MNGEEGIRDWGLGIRAGRTQPQRGTQRRGAGALVVGARWGQVLPVGVIFLVVAERIIHAGKLWR
jgi:hypothetical protein